MTENAFTDAKKTEAQGLAALIPYANEQGVQIVVTEGQEYLQKVYGDFIALFRNRRVESVEAKIEQTKTGNAFLESWSHRKRRRRGWMDTCRADKLWLYFLDANELFVMGMGELRNWAFEQGNIERFREVPQRKRSQTNDTWGWLVGLDILAAELESFRGPITPAVGENPPCQNKGNDVN